MSGTLPYRLLYETSLYRTPHTWVGTKGLVTDQGTVPTSRRGYLLTCVPPPTDGPGPCSPPFPILHSDPPVTPPPPFLLGPIPSTDVCKDHSTPPPSSFPKYSKLRGSKTV